MRFAGGRAALLCSSSFALYPAHHGVIIRLQESRSFVLHGLSYLSSQKRFSVDLEKNRRLSKGSLLSRYLWLTTAHIISRPLPHIAPSFLITSPPQISQRPLQSSTPNHILPRRSSY